MDAKGSLLISARPVGNVPLSAISWPSLIQAWLGEADRAENFAEFALGEADSVKDCNRRIGLITFLEASSYADPKQGQLKVFKCPQLFALRLANLQRKWWLSCKSYV
jgi:hypothetical protein